ncbi:MAG TPA: M48 family metalloprotease [Caulobacteraceae bacterium]
MPAFDPSDAADRYLGALSPNLRAAGAAFAQQREAAWLVGGALIIAAAVVALKLGLIGRLSAALQARRPRPWLAGALCAATLLFIVVLVKLPLDVANEWLGDRTRLGPTASILVYLARVWSGDFMAILVLTIVLTLMLALARVAPRTWWIWGGAVLGAVAIILIWGPYAARTGPAPLPPLPAGPARDGMLKLIHDAGLSAHQVYLVPSPEVDGDVTGLPGQARVVVNQGMVQEASVGEMRATIGHLAGHFVHGDQFGLALLLAVMIAASLLVIDRLHGPLARRLGAPGVQGLADPAGLPVWLILVVLCLGAATVAERTYVRWINVRADQFSLDHAREPDGLALDLLRNWRDDKVDPGPVEEAIFFDHPSLQHRLEHAMRWKAEHGAALGVVK